MTPKRASTKRASTKARKASAKGGASPTLRKRSAKPAAAAPASPPPSPRVRASPRGRSPARAATAASGGANAGAGAGATSAGGKRDATRTSAASDELLQPRTSEFEFGGPIGATATMLLLPVLVLALNLATGAHGLLTLVPFELPHVRWDELVGELMTVRATAMIFGWFALHLVLYRVLPGERVSGVTLRTGERLEYTLNGLAAMVVSLGGLAVLWATGHFDLAALADQTVPLASASIVLSVMLTVYLYVASFARDPTTGEGKLLAAGGNSGNPLYDAFIGRELNPRGFDIDLKFVCELRPGMLGWLILNAAFLARQAQTNGAVSLSMVLVNVFQAVYILDALLNERAILTTMDIVTDGYGFMLVFGCLAWVPFTYSLQAHFLRYHPVALHPVAAAAIVAVMLAGYWVFRSANSMKDTFRSNPADPRVAHVTWLATKRGTRLMTSSWWGIARHINYAGDLLIAISWSLPTGFATPVSYFYPVYFAVLLIHRDRRDDHACALKYGDDWVTYCELVPWRIIPYVY